MDESIFRKKSIDRISSPEEIDDYMKVTTPSMWIVLGAIILLLAAAIIWSITGKIQTTIEESGQVTKLIESSEGYEVVASIPGSPYGY